MPLKGNKMKTFYVIAAILGTILPWYFFANFFISSGLDLPLFLNNLAANWISQGASADLLISFIVFCVWSYFDARKHGIKHWWLVLPASFTIGRSLALPLYLYLREDQLER